MYQRIDGGRLIGRALANHGVSRVFALQGGHIDPILYGCVNEGIEIFDARHEQGAALMAEAWGLATGETGVCAVTAGPGITNAVTGLATAYMNGSPVVVLAGRRPSNQADVWTLQDLDQIRLVEPITRWARSVADGARCGEYVRQAFAEARSGRPGPAYIDVPADVLVRKVSESAPDGLASPVATSRSAPEQDVLERVARLVERSERPLIVAGSGVHWSGAGAELSLVASTLGIPVFTVNAGRGEISDADDWCMGSPMPGGGFMSVSAAADVVLCVGVRLGFPFLNGAVFGAATLVRVDVERGEFGRGRAGEIEVPADARAFCAALAKGVEGGVTPARASWADRVRESCRAAREAFDAQEVGPGGGIHPAAVVRTMAEVGGESATYVSDGGDAMTFGIGRFPANRPGQLLATSVYFGCLGVGIPYAIAAKLAHPTEPCLLWEGDGAFGFNAMEIDTAIRHKVPFVCVVANNGTWGMSWHGQGLMYGYDQMVATELGDRPYHEVVRALGGHGERVTSLAELRPALERALSAGVPACVDVRIDPKAVSFATQAMASIGIA